MQESVDEFASKLESYAQSDDVVDLVDALTIKATAIPAGGVTHATTSRAKEDVLRKDSVNAIKNKDENSCWYALVMLPYRNHTQWKTIRHGGKMLKDSAVRRAYAA